MGSKKAIVGSNGSADVVSPAGSADVVHTKSTLVVGSNSVVQPTNTNEPGGETQVAPGAGRLTPYVDAHGRPCIGAECFTIRLDAGEVSIIANPDAESCSREERGFIRDLAASLNSGSEAVFRVKTGRK